jgi:hypothetical protein
MGRTTTVPKTVIDDICHRLKWLEIAVHRQQNRKRKTIPVYDKARLPYSMPVGTLFFTDDSHEFGFKLADGIHYAETTVTSL